MSERPEFHNPQNWHSRGYLPHYDAAGKFQMITYRLADSLPKIFLGELAGSADCQSAPMTSDEKIHRRKAIENYLDQGYGSCLLGQAQFAQIVIDNWRYFDGQRYALIACVVMPNHVHILIEEYKGFAVGSLVKTWKSFTAKAIRKSYVHDADCQSALPGILMQGEPFWQREYWDRFIRDEKHFKSAVAYILDNPLKAGLCESRENWPWSFCYRHS